MSILESTLSPRRPAATAKTAMIPSAFARVAGILGVVTAGLAASVAQAQQSTVRCIDGGKYTCLSFQLTTAPDPAGTKVTVRAAVLEGATIPGVPASIAWARLHAIEVVGPIATFGTKYVVSADPTVTLVGSATAQGDLTERWFAENVGDDDVQGFTLYTPYTEGGAEVVGCTLPPDITYPYISTCNTGTSLQEGAVEFTFLTTGTWNATDAMVGLVVSDAYGFESECYIAGTQFDDPAAKHCVDPTAPPPNSAPVARLSPITIGPYLEGVTSITFKSTSSDPDGDALSEQWTFGDGATAAGSTVSHVFGDGGSYTVTLTVTDGQGLSDSRSVTLTIANVAPTGTLVAPSNAAEGAPFSLSVTNATDPSSVDVGAGLQYAFDCGSGFGAYGADATATCRTADNGTFTVGARVRDKDSGVSEYTSMVTVANAAPHFLAFTVPATASSGSTVAITASADDPSSVDRASLQFAFDCGTGFGAFTSTASASCSVSGAGSVTLRARVRDKDGDEATAAQTLQIINAMDVQPGTISLSKTGTISVYLFSTATFNATTADALNVRLAVIGSGRPGALVMRRGTAPMTSVADYNGDGRPDRLFVFERAALQGAGLTLTATQFSLEQTSAASFVARDLTPPAIVP
jgi:hypothetical protein